MSDLREAARPMRLIDMKREYGIHVETVRDLAHLGHIARVGLGIYAAPEVAQAAGSLADYAEVAIRLRGCVIIGRSAAYLHGLVQADGDGLLIGRTRGASGDRSGRTVGGGEHKRAVIISSLHPSRLSWGITEIEVAGVPVGITDTARTVVDMLTSNDVAALDALHAYANAPGASAEALLEGVDRTWHTGLARSKLREIIKSAFRSRAAP